MNTESERKRDKKRIEKILEIILFPILNTNWFENAHQENSSASFSRSIRGQQKENHPWLFVRGWTVYLRGIHRQPETSQTRSNGTKVAETKEKKGELEESTTRMRSTRKRDKIERKINRDRLTLDEVNLSNRYHWGWCTHDFFMRVF